MIKYPNIYGFNKNSEMGMSVFAPTIFLKGCNLRCPYCMNLSLANGAASKVVKLKDIGDYIGENKSEWVSISGGEPTLQNFKEMRNLFRLIKSWGCKISMSTNGLNPERLKSFIPYLDYIALDVKSSRNIDYNKIALNEGDHLKSVKQSKSFLVKYLDNFEIRTTLHPVLINEETLREIGEKFISKNDVWILQQYRPVKEMFNYCAKPYGERKLKAFVGIAKKYTCNVELRYV
jgi:pyruvate formate lyase activating enzyme